MKKWITILIVALMLCGCGKAEEKPEKVEKQSEIDVKIKPQKEEKSDSKSKKTTMQDKKKTKQHSTTEEPVQTNTQHTTYDTERYNSARLCLTTPGKEDEASCKDIVNTPEYSKAWNNLTNEGYICKSGQCDIQAQASHGNNTGNHYAPATNEEKQNSSIPITTEVIPAKPARPTTEEPVTTEPVKDATKEPKDVTTEDVKQTSATNSNLKKIAPEDNTDANDQ